MNENRWFQRKSGLYLMPREILMNPISHSCNPYIRKITPIQEKSHYEIEQNSNAFLEKYVKMLSHLAQENKNKI